MSVNQYQFVLTCINQVLFDFPNTENKTNNNVLLRERKRHIARRVTSVYFANLSPDGGTPFSLGRGGGTPPSLGLRGIPHPVLDGGTPSSLGWGGVPHPVLNGGYPIKSSLGGGTQGTPPS